MQFLLQQAYDNMRERRNLREPRHASLLGCVHPSPVNNQKWQLLMSDATNRANAAGRKAGEREAQESPQRDKALPEQTSQRIRDELMAYYDGLVNEPLPDRFVQLLQQLEQREKAGQKAERGERSGGGDK
ncbi:MAG: NepR family anti-sigma factor [Tistlia sp.]|uniref:NepR family anti-sigma factor n=1 Tax=Tistlia sp. TaxID=3057121 RepID=UPI0034A1FA6A